MNHSTDRSVPTAIPFARPSITDAEKEAVNRVLDSGWLTTGAEAARFEEEFAEAVGARYALSCASATAGLHLALEAAGVGRGDRVAVTPYTFAATAEVVRYLDADPVFVDIAPDSPNMSPDALAEVLDRATSDGGKPVSAVIPVHMGGLPCDMAAIREVAEAAGATVIEDAAHAFPAAYSAPTASAVSTGINGTEDTTMVPVGSSGTAVFSFYANKPITTGEGGMIVTDDEEIASRIRLMRLHGIDRPVWNRYRTPGATWEYDIVAAGYKYNMPDILAALGRVQLSRSRDLHEARRAHAQAYMEGFHRAAVDELRRRELLLPTQQRGHAWHLFSVQVDSNSRDRVIAELAEHGIGTSVHYKPLHMMSYYHERYGLVEADYPNAADRFRKSISLPLYPDLRSDEREFVIESLSAAVRGC